MISTTPLHQTGSTATGNVLDFFLFIIFAIAPDCLVMSSGSSIFTQYIYCISWLRSCCVRVNFGFSMLLLSATYPNYPLRIFT